MKEKKKVSFVFFIFTLLFFYLPLLVLVIYSFNEGKTMKWTGFSFHWYEELFTRSKELWNAFENSIIIALLSSLASTVIGTLGAIGIYWYRFRHKKLIQTVSYLPLMLPDIIIGISLLIFFAGIGLNLSLTTIFIAHTTFNIPYVLFILIARLQEFDYSVIEASYDLGAKEKDTLLKIILPIIKPGIIAGFLMAMTLSLDDFVITFFVSGPGSSTLPLHIFSMIRFGVSPVINALAVILIAATAFLALLSKNMQKYIYQS